MLLDEWDAEYCMDSPSTFHMRKYYVLKSQGHNPDTPTYIEAQLGEYEDEYYNVVDDEIQSLMITYTWEIFSRNSSSDQDVIPGT